MADVGTGDGVGFGFGFRFGFGLGVGLGFGLGFGFGLGADRKYGVASGASGVGGSASARSSATTSSVDSGAAVVGAAGTPPPNDGDAIPGSNACAASCANALSYDGVGGPPSGGPSGIVGAVGTRLTRIDDAEARALVPGPGRRYLRPTT